MDAAVSAAREKLNNVTPLKKDCGRICNARCCLSLDGEETGMLLFPGEAETYRGKADWEIRKTTQGDLIFCSGTCERGERPLSCRMFPLLPVIGDDGKICVIMDRRARAVCPLARQGKDALDPDFIDAVRGVGELLARQEEQVLFLNRLREEQEELKRLRQKFINHSPE